MQIRGFHRVDGESRMPGVTENLKFPRWNNDLGVFEYIVVEDNHVTNIVQEGDTVTITMKDGDVYTIIVPEDIVLPGDTKVLFDENDTIGGRSNLTYDYNYNKLILTDSSGIYGKSTLFDTSNQAIIQYLGQNSLYLNFGTDKLESDMSFNNAFGAGALGALITGSGNVGIGYLAGANTSDISSNNVFIGNYAGRIEPGSDKLYIHNQDFTTLQEFRDDSLIYGDFSTGQLFINNRLGVREEVRIGTFDTLNTPLGGMVQFVSAANPIYVKPQYYDNTQWVDFANSTDTYLEDIVIDGDEYTFVINGRPPIVVTIPDTYYPSSGNQYAVQFSNGDNSFIHSDNLNWSVSNYLNINGALLLQPQTLSSYSPISGLTVNTGTHIYTYIDGSWRQLDNEITDGEANHGESIGDAVEVYAGMNIDNHNLQFYDLKGNTKINISDANEFGNILFDVDYVVSGANLGATGKTLYTDTTHTANASILNIKRIHSSDASIVLTEYPTYIDMTVVGPPAAGESNVGENVGDGTGLSYYGKNGLALQFRTIKEGNNTIIANSGQVVTIDTDPFINSLTNVGGGYELYKDSNTTLGKINSNLRTLVGVNGIILDYDIPTIGNNIEIELDPALAIPALSGNIVPVPTNVNKQLTWSLTYDADVRNTNPQLLGIAQINLGSNLIYDPILNSLDSIGGSGNPLLEVYNKTLSRNVDGTVNRAASLRDISFKLTNNTIITWDGTSDPIKGLGWLAFENDYPISSDIQKGIVQVDTSTGLTITNGVIGYTPQSVPNDKDAVLYYPSAYNIHDWHADNQGNELTPPAGSPVEPKNTRRDRARASIGASYVNGRAAEPFQAAQFVVGSTNGDFEESGYIGGTKGLYMYNNKITSDWSTTEIIKKRVAPNDSDVTASKIAVGDGVMDFTLDPRDIGGIGIFNFFMYNSAGTKVKVAVIKGRYEGGELVADFKVKGNIKFHCTDAEMNA